MAAAKLAKFAHGGDRSKSQICDLTSQAEAAKKMKIGKRSVEHARQVIERAPEEVTKAVSEGKLTKEPATMNTMACPNPGCGYKGKPRKKENFSALLCIILLCCGVVPGILYLLVPWGCRYFCPKCGIEIKA